MMQDDKLIELFLFYAHGDKRKLSDEAYAVKDMVRSADDLSSVCRHARWMASEAVGFVKEAQKFDRASRGPLPELTNWAEVHKARSKREKAHRWLGFIQSAFWLAGVFSLDELKEHSRCCSDAPERAESR